MNITGLLQCYCSAGVFILHENSSIILNAGDWRYCGGYFSLVSFEKLIIQFVSYYIGQPWEPYLGFSVSFSIHLP